MKDPNAASMATLLPMLSAITKDARIVTYFDRPAGNPDRSIDWSAWESDKDGCEPDGLFRTHPIGWGATEQEAVADLLEQIEDRRP